MYCTIVQYKRHNSTPAEILNSPHSYFHEIAGVITVQLDLRLGDANQNFVATAYSEATSAFSYRGAFQDTTEGFICNRHCSTRTRMNVLRSKLRAVFSFFKTNTQSAFYTVLLPNALLIFKSNLWHLLVWDIWGARSSFLDDSCVLKYYGVSNGV
jgi:hypothetical protein